MGHAFSRVSHFTFDPAPLSRRSTLHMLSCQPCSLETGTMHLSTPVALPKEGMSFSLHPWNNCVFCYCPGLSKARIFPGESNDKTVKLIL